MNTRQEATRDPSDTQKAGAGIEKPGTSKRFRFKSHPHSSEGDGRDGDRPRRKRRHHHSSHSGRKRRGISPVVIGDATTYDNSTSRLPPETAFRESLFDALGDDEGAAFWEGVYGQPIHNYPSTYKNEETGELEQMTEEEYAQHVRRKMWEKSWEGIEAAKEEKRQERAREKERIRKKDKGSKRKGPSSFDYDFDFDVDESLRRGNERKENRRWKQLWEEYLQAWDNLQSMVRDRVEKPPDAGQTFLRNEIAWPVYSGKRKDIDPNQIERFIINGTRHTGKDEDAATVLINTIKTERVRWHPDKIQQRYGFMDIDEGTMQGVTAVFQIFDRMWNDQREKREE